MRFKQYLINEGRSRGEDMEEGIISVWNGEQFPTGLRVDENACINIVEDLKKEGISGKGQVLGASTVQVSKEWASYFPNNKVPGSTKTPKTDFVIGKDKISLKSGGSGQLMSGGKSEATATFYTALNKSKTPEDDLINEIKGLFDGLMKSSITSGKLKDVIKSQKDGMVNRANDIHKIFQTKLSQYFETNIPFRKEFTYEAMTGETKFDKGIGACDHFLVVSWDGLNNHYKKCSDNMYIDRIASQMKTSIRFKSTFVKRKGVKTGEYRYWSVVGLVINKLNEELENDSNYLTEWSIKDTFNKIKKFIKSFVDKMVKFIKGGWSNLLEFMELTPIITINTDIVF